MSASASHMAMETALRRSGLLNVIQPIGPSFSAIIFSVLEIVIRDFSERQAIASVVRLLGARSIGVFVPRATEKRPGLSLYEQGRGRTSVMVAFFRGRD